jgi:hypothetical protein
MSCSSQAIQVAWIDGFLPKTLQKDTCIPPDESSPTLCIRDLNLNILLPRPILQLPPLFLQILLHSKAIQLRILLFAFLEWCPRLNFPSNFVHGKCMQIPDRCLGSASKRNCLFPSPKVFELRLTSHFPEGNVLVQDVEFAITVGARAEGDGGVGKPHAAVEKMLSLSFYRKDLGREPVLDGAKRSEDGRCRHVWG